MCHDDLTKQAPSSIRVDGISYSRGGVKASVCVCVCVWTPLSEKLKFVCVCACMRACRGCSWTTTVHSYIEKPEIIQVTCALQKILVEI